MSDGPCETPMLDHLQRFWKLLADEHVRILIDIRRAHDEGQPPHWDSASFPDDFAKALVAQHTGKSTIAAAIQEEIDHGPKDIEWALPMLSVKFEDGGLVFLKQVKNLGHDLDTGISRRSVNHYGSELVVERRKGESIWRPLPEKLR